jgi:hypothetical protein
MVNLINNLKPGKHYISSLFTGIKNGDELYSFSINKNL